jgi:hypothetical protein
MNESSAILCHWGETELMPFHNPKNETAESPKESQC